MSNVDAGLVDVLELLAEVDGIGRDIELAAQQGAPLTELEDARRRHRRLCDQLLEQLRGRLLEGWCVLRVH